MRTPQALIATTLLTLSIGTLSPVASAAVDADAAKKIFKKNDCTKCHVSGKTKKGPSLEDLAKKWKAKPDAEPKLMEHLRSEPMVKIKDDGKEIEEKHKAIEVKDDAELKNVIQYILSH